MPPSWGQRLASGAAECARPPGVQRAARAAEPGPRRNHQRRKRGLASLHATRLPLPCAPAGVGLCPWDPQGAPRSEDLEPGGSALTSLAVLCL